jgi:hypothetical protein
MLHFLPQLLTAVAFWVTISSTEGWKWRQNDGTPDNSPVITWNSYHIWRSFTTAAVLLMPLTYVGLSSFLTAHVVGWLCYERWMSLVEYGTLLYKRPIFHVLGNIWIPRPSPWVEIGIIVLSFVGYFVLAAFSHA